MTVVNFRTDDEAQRALDELTADGTSVSVAIRQALLDSVIMRKRDRMRREALEVVDDAADLAESRAILAHMEELREG
jgi:predicted transcriptional regulator